MQEPYLSTTLKVMNQSCNGYSVRHFNQFVFKAKTQQTDVGYPVRFLWPPSVTLYYMTSTAKRQITGLT